MPITELALIRLLPSTTLSTPSLLPKLAHAKTVMQNFTGYSFYFLQQIEDPSLIYIIGEWDSLDQHMNEFIPSQANQSVLETLKDDLTVEWLFHISVPQSQLPIPRTMEQVVGITRHFVKAGEKEKFTELFEENRSYLQDYVTEGKIGGGWRVESGEGENEECVLLCPWKEVRQHEEFAETKGFEKYGVIREVLKGAEIKHARLVEV